MERLQKIIAASGFCSRRKAELYIESGKVKVNGQVIDKLGSKASYNDEIEVDGYSILKKTENVYYIVNKPKGYLSSVSDDRNRACVTDLIEEEANRLFPVGRLDYNTSGLLLLTNDGEFSQLMTHPRFKIPKKYRVRCKGRVSKLNIAKLASGIEIDGYKTKKALVKVNKYDKVNNITDIFITIYEGRNQQIRKMFLAIDHPVRQLKRVEYAFLNVDNMPTGSYRRLTIHEVKQLISLARYGKK